MKESFNDNSLRNVVLQTLIDNHPISARKIYETVKAGYIQNVTYPAVYKTLKVMAHERKLVKHRREFSINLEWIQSLKKFVEAVELTHAGKQRLPSLDEIKENESRTFVFDSLAEADDYRKKIQMQYFRQKNQPPFCAFYNHLRSPVIYSEKSITAISAIQGTNMKCFLVVKGNTTIDKWCVDYYTKDKLMFAVIGVPLNMDVSEILVMGDIVMQMIIDKNIEKIIHNIYGKAKKITDIDVPRFYKSVYEKKGITKFVIFKNKTVAEQMRQQALSYFKAKKR